MRKALVILSTLLVVCVQAARADIPSNSAPADEYFGPSGQSVLEIRNRLDDYDKRDTREMIDPGVTTDLNHIEMAILDWQHKYPRDPWLPHIMAHLMREYWRAGQSSSVAGTAALSLMRTAYGDSPETSATVAMVYGSNGPLTEVARDKAPYEEEPVETAAIPEYAPAPLPSGPNYYAPPGASSLPSYAVPAYASTPSYAIPGSVAAAPEPAPQSDAVPQSEAAPQSDAVPQSETASQSQPAADAPADSSTDVAPPDDGAPTPPPTR